MVIMFKKTNTFYFLFVFFVNSILFSIEENINNRISEKDFKPQKEKEIYPVPTLPDEDKGLFVSSNAGVSFDMYGAKAVYRSAVYEAILGYHLSSRFKLGASYQYYAPLHIRGSFLIRDYYTGQSEVKHFKYDVYLQSVALKVYFSPEHPIRWNEFILSPYFSFGTGLGYLEFSQKSPFSYVNSRNFLVKSIRIKRMYLFYPLVMSEGGLTFGTDFFSLTTGIRIGRYQSVVFNTGFFSLVPYLGLQLTF